MIKRFVSTIALFSAPIKGRVYDKEVCDVILGVSNVIVARLVTS